MLKSSAGEKQRIERGRQDADISHQAAAGGYASSGIGQTHHSGSDTGQADALRPLADREANCTQKLTALGSAQNFTRQKWSVTLNGDVEIIFECHRNYILHRQI